MTVTSFAQLKRELKPGVALKLVDTDVPCHKLLGIVRKVDRQQTNAIMFVGGSWLYLSAAKDFTFQENGFTYDSNGTMLKYEFAK